MKLFSELRRRNVFRMAALYCVAAWLIMQVAGVLIDLAKLPDWTGTTTLWILAVGFPIALVVSWFYELTPDGVSLERDKEPGVSIASVTGRRLDLIVISLLCAAVILFAYDKWWTHEPIDNSIAVMPFENMSADQEQEFFSDGISEEILNLLAQIPDLRVISRTSAFSFRDKEISVSEIGRTLNVSHILEGSVRKSGDRIRISAQLIRADNGFHIWSDSFDRSLNDVFAVQYEIANLIGRALKSELALDDPVLKASSHLPDDAITTELRREGVSVRGQTESSEAHIAYLKGRYHLNKRSPDGLRNAKLQFETAIELDPEYALAYSGLADSYMLLAGYGHMPALAARENQRKAVYKAIELDDRLAEVHASLGTLYVEDDWNWDAAAKEFLRAIEINPNYAQALQWYGNLLAMIADPTHLSVMERAHAADPVSLRVNVDYGLAYYYDAQYEKAVKQLQNAIELDPSFLPAYSALGLVLLETGSFDEAIEAIAKGSRGNLSVWLGYAHARAGNDSEARATLERWHERWRDSRTGAIPIALIHVGLTEHDLAFEWLNRAVDTKDSGITTLQTYAYWEPIRKDLRYTRLLRRLNFLP